MKIMQLTNLKDDLTRSSGNKLELTGLFTDCGLFFNTIRPFVGASLESVAAIKGTSTEMKQFVEMVRNADGDVPFSSGLEGENLEVHSEEERRVIRFR